MSLDAQILLALRGPERGQVSGADLALRLGVTRAAIWARVNELRQLGYDISASPHGGYRLLGAPDVLHADDLLARLGQTQVIGRDIRVFQETTSTNDIVDKLARDGVKEGAVIFAESQTRGRGRMGREWVSPPGKGLWFSVLLRPNCRPQESTRLTVAAATALARAIHLQTGLQPDIKWPNDLLFNGRKVAGILTELTAELDRVRYVVLGLGVSVNLRSQEFPPALRKVATSLRIEAGRSLDRAELAVNVLRELDRDYARVRAGQFEVVAEEWAALCATLGKEVSIVIGSRRVRGRAEALDREGALLVRTEHGRLETVTGGDVTLEK